MDDFKDNFTKEEKKAGTRKSGFMKYDTGKPDLTLPPPELEEAVAIVMGFGAKKYGRDNWKKCTNHLDYIAAAKRHCNAILKGEVFDEDSGLPHVDHLACCAAFLVWMQRNPPTKG